jgi:AcrR family transcriptional regulator
MALGHQQRDQIERRIRAAIDRRLAGQIPSGGACDVKMLAREAGISRASFYRTWGHLKDEFEKRRAAAWAAGRQPDPRKARIARLRDINQRLTGKLARTHAEFNELRERHRLLLAVLAAKDDELQRLRHELSTFSCASPAPVPATGQGVTRPASSPCPSADVTPDPPGHVPRRLRRTRLPTSVHVALTAEGRVTLHTATYPLAAVDDAIADLDAGRLVGRGILVPGEG